MPGPLTYWRTLRYLQPVQIYGRVWFRVARPRIAVRPAPERRTLTGEWVSPAQRSQTLTGPTTLTWAGQSTDVDARGWDDPSLDKLRRYNLHYFDDLNSAAGAARREWHVALMRRWVADNPPAHGAGWEPYPTSLRIANWIKWALAGNTLPDECVASLATQTRWLARRIEWHLRGNHLFVNAKALMLAGLFFDGPEAAKWLATGVAILERELDEQILPDGGQFERSPMYHDLALEDVLDLCNAARTFDDALFDRARALVASLRSRILAMHHWSVTMRHPDGEISFFNDAAFGIAPAPTELDEYAARLGFRAAPSVPGPLTHLSSSGYVRIQRVGMVALLDVAPIGPHYLPAHAHADTLSFELSLGAQRVFVNSGTSQYGSDTERQRQRGTAAHNTVVVDNVDSSEMWGGFRVARRARPLAMVITSEPSTTIRCAHDGYRRLAGKALHIRTWRFDESSMTIDDTIEGRFGRAEARFHLHPALSASVVAGAAVLIDGLPDGRNVRLSCAGGALRVEPSTWHPAFGTSIPSLCIIAQFAGPSISTRVEW